MAIKLVCGVDTVQLYMTTYDELPVCGVDTVQLYMTTYDELPAVQ